MNGWNFIGILAWIIVIALLFLVVFNIRNRHLKILVEHKTKITWKTVCLDALEILVVIVAVIGMLYVSLFSRVDLNNKQDIAVSYKCEPMIMQTTKDGQGYYIKIDKNSSNGSNNVYQYWLDNSKYSVSSREASISDGTLPFNVSGVHLNWPMKKISKMDQKYQYAYVVTAEAKYKSNFINGLGMRAGHYASEYRVLRVPARSFINYAK
ncbi:LVIS_2131 family protein [Companilactobacillus sp.]|uniref:LVIS_2131 family protein n=1 Tax=Companilactobacillus sp. TaxID=2767905 RepID=UPI00262A1B84|nr:LVIS_2131 family protein [Companilactobacillus sp.]